MLWAGRCFWLRISAMEGEDGWSLAQRDGDGSEQLGGSLVFLHLQCDHSCVAPSGKNHFLCSSFTSPSCPACLPRAGRPQGKGTGARAETPRAPRGGFPSLMAPIYQTICENHPGKQKRGSWHCCVLAEMAALCVHPLKHVIYVYIHIYLIFSIKGRCHFTLSSQLAQRKVLPFSLLLIFPQLSAHAGNHIIRPPCPCPH